MVIFSMSVYLFNRNNSYFQQIQLPKRKLVVIQLIVVSALMLIFFMNQLDPTYLKYTLITLILSQIMDITWLIFNIQPYWSPSKSNLTCPTHQLYLKLITLLNFLSILIKIPLSLFICYFRTINPTKTYTLDLYFTKIQLKANSSS